MLDPIARFMNCIHFSHAYYRNVLTAIKESFTCTGEEFMECVAERLRVYYDDWIKGKRRGWINALSAEGTRLGAVKDVSFRQYPE